MKPTFSDIQRVLGPDAVLLPLAGRGSKRITTEGWQKTTLEETRARAYQAKLGLGEVGVLLGERGGGICTVDLDADDAADAFLEANPCAAMTLRTRGSRGCNFWFRIKGEIPKAGLIKRDDETVGEWRAGGNQTKIMGWHTDAGRSYEWLVDAPPLAIKFEELCWPEGWEPPRLKTPLERVTDEWGAPFVGCENGLKINQRALAALFAAKNDLLFERDEGRFYAYQPDRGLWVVESPAKLKSRVLDMISELARAQDDDLREQLELKRTDQLGSSLVRLLQGDLEQVNVFGTPRRLVHVLNGVIELGADSLTLRDFCLEDYSRNQLPIAFEAGATCPRFRELLAHALAEDDASLLQRWVGNVLLGGNPGQLLMIQEGAGGTGKSTVASVIEQLIGVDNVQELRTGRLEERFELTRFVGKRLLAGRDVPGDFLSRRGAATLKALTGGDRLQGEVKGGHGTPVVDGIDVLVSSNSRLRVRLDGDVTAWRRRLLIVTYAGARPSKPIPDYDQLLIREEGAGILLWALQGARAFSHELTQHGRIQLSERQTARVDALLAESDSVRAFVEACVERDAGGEVRVDELKVGYNAFCEARDWTPLGGNELERQLPDLILSRFGVTKRHDVAGAKGQRRGWKGIRLNPPT